MSDHIDTIVAGILGGGLLYGLAQVIRALSNRRRANDEHETGSIAVQGASEAVLTMQRALDAANSQIDFLSDQLRRTTEHYEQEIAALRQQVQALRLALRNDPPL